MKTLFKRVSLLLIAGAVIGGSVVTVPALAATSSSTSGTTSTSANGMKVSPVRTDLTINPGSSKTIDVYIQNVTGTKATLAVLLNDFEAGKDESGTPMLLLDGRRAPQHGLKQYITPIDNVVVQPNEQKDIKVTIRIPEGTPGGGYFGAVRFVPISSPSSDRTVTLGASVGSLILVKVPGDYKEKLSLASFDVAQGNQPGTFFTSSRDLKAVARFTNQGDVQEEPFGKVLLKKGDKTLGSYEINNTIPRGSVLPASTRRFEVPLKDAGSFGKFTLQGNFGYGSNGQLLTASRSFYVIPVFLIIAVIVIILLILFAIFGLPRLIRSYNKKVVSRASRR